MVFIQTSLKKSCSYNTWMYKVGISFQELDSNMMSVISECCVCVCVHSATFLKTEERSRTGCKVGVSRHFVKTLSL